MNQIILADVAYVHAAAQDCKPATVLPPMYGIGDVVRVERTSGATIDVELSMVDEEKGLYCARVVASAIDEVPVGANVVFQYQ